MPKPPAPQYDTCPLAAWLTISGVQDMGSSERVHVTGCRSTVIQLVERFYDPDLGEVHPCSFLFTSCNIIVLPLI